MLDNAGHTRTSRVARARRSRRRASRSTAPGRRRARARPRAAAARRSIPERADPVGHLLPARRRRARGPRSGTDTSSPDYTVVDDISGLGLAAGDAGPLPRALDGGRRQRGPEPVADGDRRRTAGRHGDRPLPPRRPGTTPAGACTCWATRSRARCWRTCRGATRGRYAAVDDFGARFEVALRDDTAPLNYIIHQPEPRRRAGRARAGRRPVVHAVHIPEVWIVQGDPTIHTTRPPGT